MDILHRNFRTNKIIMFTKYDTLFDRKYYIRVDCLFNLFAVSSMSIILYTLKVLRVFYSVNLKLIK